MTVVLGIEDPHEIDAFLAHYGVKGMKWGIRKEDSSSPKESRFTPEQKATAKKVAIGVGVLVAAAGAAYVANVMYKNGNLPLSSLKAPDVSAAKKVVKDIVEEPIDIIHASRGKDVGFQFLKRGGLKDSYEEYKRAGFTAEGGGDKFERYGASKEKIAARFRDPDERSDWTGRPIFHEVVIPKSMADGIENLDDVKSKVWPLIKDQFDEFYVKKPEQRF